jgi:hypothetical protein
MVDLSKHSKVVIVLVAGALAALGIGTVIYMNNTSASVRTEAVSAIAREEMRRINDLEKVIAALKTKLEAVEAKQLQTPVPTLDATTKPPTPPSKVKILWYNNFFGHPYYLKPEHIAACSAWCEFIHDTTMLNDPSVAGVIFHAKDFNGWPKKTVTHQHWIWWELESQSNSGWPASLSENIDIVFTFNLEAEVVSLYSDPYAATKHPVHTIQEKNAFRKQGHAPLSILVSNCMANNNRKEYIEELLKHIKVDSFGGCVHTKDMPPDNDKLKLISQYKFYLAFENSNCKDYVTEKYFQALHVGTVPIVFGAPNIDDFIPANHSVINVEHFPSPKALAEYVKYLDENDDRYLEYLAYKDTTPGSGDGIGKVYPAWKNRFQPMSNGWEVMGFCKLCQYAASRKPMKTNFVRPPCRNLHVNLKP